MGIKYFSLGTSENNRLERIIRIMFGAVCIAIAIFWVIFNIKSLKTSGSPWITIIFLSGFGSYQIWTGIGMAARFIEIGTDKIRLKNNPILPAIIMLNEEIEKIEIYPLNLIFFLKSQKRIMLRFGTIYQETNEKIKDEILGFAESNKILFEIVQEEL
jgi:hypothetical protein